MVQIGETLVSFSIFREYFCCDSSRCLGACCIEGEAGAPVSTFEIERLEEAYELIKGEMTLEACQVVGAQGVVYPDPEGDLVTSIVNGKDCVFASKDEKGCCICLIEKAYKEGRTSWRKPISCFLYPVRLGRVADMVSVNMHKWDICKSAVVKGRRKDIRAYVFLKEPLVERFGVEWYNELLIVAKELEAQGYI